jgi:hypothetical protein
VGTLSDTHEHDHGVDSDLSMRVAERARDLLFELTQNIESPAHRVCPGCINVGAKAYALATLRATAEFMPEHAPGLLPILEAAERQLQEALAGVRLPESGAVQ